MARSYIPVIKVIDGVLVAIGVVAVLGMMLHTLANAVLRHAADDPIAGTLEYVSGWYMPVAVFLGIYLAQKSGEHIEARLIFDRISGPVRRELLLFGHVLTIVVAAGMAYYGWLEAVEALHLELTLGASGVVIWPVLFIVPFAFVLLVVRLMVDAVVVAKSHGLDAQAGPADHAGGRHDSSTEHPSGTSSDGWEEL